ncbi:MAG: YafY family transcriptional regulator [Sphaerobacteraceae bacterium]|nr:MAG: YafY family transcriptional regulator [Sphaerobacteraceae bacterium]
MYHPTTRVLTVLELLQTYGQIRSDELARRLETTPRSVRRYITMLQELGIPVVSKRGRYGGYRLRPGYKLPPLMFTNQEAIAVTLGLLHAHRLGIQSDETAISGALAKIGRVLPETVQQQVGAIMQSTVLDDVSPVESAPATTVLDLSLAVQDQKQVWIRYRTWNNETARIIDPYGLILRDGLWYLAGWCHLRDAIRVFRLDRIHRHRILSRTFTRPEGFDTRDTVLRSLEERFAEPAVELLLETTEREAKRWVSAISAKLTQTPEGLVMTCDTGSLAWLATFVSSMPWPVQVRRPPELMDELRTLSRRIAAISYEPAPEQSGLEIPTPVDD